jgi:hypothetical protein
MAASKEERDRILHLIEDGQVTAEQAAQLLDALEPEQHVPHVSERTRDRIIRVRATGVNARLQKVLLNATFPLNLVRIGLRLGVRLVPQLSESALEELLRTVENGSTGRVLDLQDMEKGERLEIFVE